MMMKMQNGNSKLKIILRNILFLSLFYGTVQGLPPAEKSMTRYLIRCDDMGMCHSVNIVRFQKRLDTLPLDKGLDNIPLLSPIFSPA
jgi:hypothetical protein